MAQHRFLVFLISACAMLLSAEAAAQRPRPAFLEGSIGMSVGGGGTFDNREGMALDALLGLRIRPAKGGTLVGGISAGMHGPVTHESCQLGPDGECIPDFPLLLSVGTLLGVDKIVGELLSVRLLAGPTLYHGYDEGGRTLGTALGLQGRLDLATPTHMLLAVVPSLRVAVLPSFDGNFIGFAALGLGFRIQP